MAILDFSTPPSTIFNRLLEGGAFPYFVQLIETAGMKEELITGGPFTVFVPTDEAIDASEPEKLKEFKEALKDPVKAREVLNRYIINDTYRIHQLAEMGSIQSRNGYQLNFKVICHIKDEDNLDMDVGGGKVDFYINDTARVTLANVPCLNGLIHIIDKLY